MNYDSKNAIKLLHKIPERITFSFSSASLSLTVCVYILKYCSLFGNCIPYWWILKGIFIFGLQSFLSVADRVECVFQYGD